MPNMQPPEGSTDDDLTLDLQDVFLTIQGEGPFSGRRALFVRLAGCNLQCPGCDTDYTSKRQLTDIFTLSKAVASMTPSRATLIVVTGGEPFRQGATPGLVRALNNMGFTVQVETNGTLFPEEMYDLMRDRADIHIVCSPKTPRIAARLKNLCKLVGTEERIHFKYVLDANQLDSVGLPKRSLEHPAPRPVYRPYYARTEPNRIYVQPYDVPIEHVDTGAALADLMKWTDALKAKEKATADNWRAVIDASITHGYTAQLQIHKLLELQ